MSVSTVTSEIAHVQVACRPVSEMAPHLQRASQDTVQGALKWVADKYSRGGVRRRNLTVHLSGVRGRADDVVLIPSVIEANSVLPEAPVHRAPYVDIGGDSADSRYEGLKGLDKVQNKGAKGGAEFERKSSRMEGAIRKRGMLRNPSFQVCRYQLPFSYGYKARRVTTERHLLGPTLDALHRAKRRPGYPQVVKDSLDEAVDLGDYTTHDPDTLHKRFLEYVHERVEGVSADTKTDFLVAVQVMWRVWSDAGVAAEARPFSDATPEGLDAMFTTGNAGEYRKHGVESRRDPRALDMLSKHVQGFTVAGRNMPTGMSPPAFVDRLDHVTTSFGKREPKKAKIVNGQRVAPVPRFIFNPSPCSYAMGAFLHSDISHALQDRDPLHGPGFGPGRGRAVKFTRIVEAACPDGSRLRGGCKAVMSDIEKWDANMSEFLIGTSFDALEAFVDKSKLAPLDRASREASCRYMRRTLMEKLVEHPSGYLVHLYGCMPSGSFYTSLLNTVANTLLALALLARRMRLAEKPIDIAAMARSADGALLSYGDNQLIITSLFEAHGVEYDMDDHAELLSEVGMRLKKDETEVSDRLDRIRFCSRAVVRTPAGMAITRPHGDVVAKLVARPTENSVDDKLYVRALMADYMGVDPIVHRILADVDATIRVTIDAVRASERHRDTLRSAASQVFGRKDDDAIAATAQLMAKAVIDRRVLLELTQPRSVNDVDSVLERTGKVTGVRFRQRFAASVGIQTDVPSLVGPAAWLASQDEQQYLDYLVRTDQVGVMH
ncbi:RNA dependent RNA polymerase [Beauveria bassiana polymycovirus 1]|uniref:RNA dependent RNA polymerase n=1 Tax=Beauveria bassiana polymycovirus 1 TaxID=1740646 RepID=A0A1V1IEY9_9VIRU|nr:RNA dependent RNA polymerase [Beauveria bassiana polymycovirus 1]CUS18595.1 RNA dependent RNA polymerase [Beauveria bassiana polymycovirus 1]